MNPPERTIFVNDKWVLRSSAQVPFNDAGFLYGDGIFETIRFQNRHLFRPDKHLERLRHGLSVVRMYLPRENAEIIQLLEDCVRRNTLSDGTLRLMVTRGLITKTPWMHDGLPGLYITIRSLSPRPADPVKVIYMQEADYPLIRFNPAIKSMNYVGNMLAKQEAEQQGGYEPVFINREGFITECAIRNIFYIKDSTLITPSLELGVLPGVMRDTLIHLAAEEGMTVQERVIPYNTVNEMQEAFISSTGIGLIPCYWDNFTSEFPITRHLQQQLDQLIEMNDG